MATRAGREDGGYKAGIENIRPYAPEGPLKLGEVITAASSLPPLSAMRLRARTVM